MQSILSDKDRREIHSKAMTSSLFPVDALIEETQAAVLAKLGATPVGMQVPPPRKYHKAFPLDEQFSKGWNACREAMLATAPEAPATAVLQVPQDEKQRLLSAFTRFCKNQGWAMDTIENSHGSAPDGRIYTDPRTRSAWNWENWREVTISAVSKAPEKPALVQVPTGYKLVPVEPTLAMVEAVTQHSECSGQFACAVWIQMLTAAPESPVQDETDAEKQVNCAEEILDGYAAHLDLEETSFECIGDYITAVCEALKGKQ